jgi:single-strand DNA-binding protein
MNILQIAGHLGADPETRFTPSGQKVTTLRVATNVRKGGKDETVWFRVTIWGDRFDKMLTYLKKGSAIIAVGELGKPEIYTDKEGRPQISLEMTAEFIRFSPFGKTERSGQEQQQSVQANQGQQPYQGAGSPSFGEQSYGTQAQGSQNARGYGNSQQNLQEEFSDEERLPF